MGTQWCFICQLTKFIFLPKLITQHAILVHFIKFWVDPIDLKHGRLASIAINGKYLSRPYLLNYLSLIVPLFFCPAYFCFISSWLVVLVQASLTPSEKHSKLTTELKYQFYLLMVLQVFLLQHCHMPAEEIVHYSEPLWRKGKRTEYFPE